MEETRIHINKINGAAEQISKEEVVGWAFLVSGPSECDTWADLNGLDEKKSLKFCLFIIKDRLDDTPRIAAGILYTFL